MKRLILSVVDFFFPLFSKFIPLQTFRYAACGGANTVLDIILFRFFEQYFAGFGVVHAAGMAFKPHNAAFIAAFCVTFPTGFYLSRYVVFPESTVRGRIQLVRYFLLVLACVALNYLFLNLFIVQFRIEPTVAKIITSVIVVTFSYLSQKHFTFKVRKLNIHRGEHS